MVKQHGLLIGINEYPQVADATLSGCTNDVALIGSLLIDRFGFTEDSCIVLLDHEATRAALCAAFEEILCRAGQDDLVVCFYAGHGSRIADPHQPDRFIESIVPTDSGRGETPNRDILDLEIDRWVQRLNAVTPYVTLIFDCCHSGSVTRDSFGEATREIAADLRPPESMFERGLVPPALSTPRPLTTSRGAAFVSGRRHAVTLAACRADEQANEHLAREHGATYRHGALSFFLARSLLQARSGATWRDLYEQLAATVSTRYQRQHPQLEGKVDELLFGCQQVRPASYLSVSVPANSVSVPDAGEVELMGGAAHGVSSGSLWSIREAGARNLDDGKEIATVEVASVHPVKSRARPITGAEPGQIQTGLRAFLRQQQLPEPGLRLALSAGSESSRLAERVRGSQLLQLSQEPATADVLVYYLAARDTVAPGAPCPGLGPLAQPTWAAVGRDGRLAVRQYPEPADLDALVCDLDRLARYRRLLELDNPDHASRLRGCVRLQVRNLDRNDRIDLGASLQNNVKARVRQVRQIWTTICRCISGIFTRMLRFEDGVPGGSWAGAHFVRKLFGRTQALDRVTMLREGERVDITIENSFHEPVWMTLVELGCDNAIKLLMPHPEHASYRPQAGIRLAPGELISVREYYLGDPDFAPAVAEGLPLHLPDGFPWAAEPGESERADIGYLHLKLLVTLHDTSFELLQQEAVRCEPAAPEMDWATVTVAIAIGRQ